MKKENTEDDRPETALEHASAVFLRFVEHGGSDFRQKGERKWRKTHKKTYDRPKRNQTSTNGVAGKAVKAVMLFPKRNVEFGNSRKKEAENRLIKTAINKINMELTDFYEVGPRFLGFY